MVMAVDRRIARCRQTNLLVIGTATTPHTTRNVPFVISRWVRIDVGAPPTAHAGDAVGGAAAAGGRRAGRHRRPRRHQGERPAAAAGGVAAGAVEVAGAPRRLAAAEGEEEGEAAAARISWTWLRCRRTTRRRWSGCCWRATLLVPPHRRPLLPSKIGRTLMKLKDKAKLSSGIQISLSGG